MSRTRKLLLAAMGVSFAASAAYLAAVRRGLLPAEPHLLAAFVTAALVLLFVEGLLTARALGRTSKLATGGKLAMIGGLLAIGSAGFANWLFSLQGFLVLTEGDVVPLSGGRHLQVLDAGPLANVGEMNASVELGRVNLRPGPGGAYFPETRLVIARPGEKGRVLELRPDHAAASGSLRFHQGAFGFSPRLVVLRGEQTLLDETVPFTTRKEGSELAFEGEARIESEDLTLNGVVSLESLDERMRGHPTLVVEVSKGVQVIGRGELKVGHFAEIQGGYRVGFAGLKKWVEVDLSRRTYRLPMLAGAAIALLGAATWAAAAWKQRVVSRRSRPAPRR